MGGSRKQKQSKLAAEVLHEEQKKLEAARAARALVLQESTKAPARKKKKCSCGVRDFMKELIRRLRGFEDRLHEFKEDLALKRRGLPTKDVLQGCRHDALAENKAEQRNKALE